ncbi:hypothetical protein E6R60_32090 [Streptomyces sp. A0642]|uniref:hypothetical protein n=1 Tax=Streptomyces sp. A0642 TaxID=2563100 RepID=UPI0010A2A8B2|nr:hypothetical protein [Streptomyces sp. A0642]THA67207.1 hypothetical protein E6R60_32090 [Streptomyces sp. A0642]
MTLTGSHTAAPGAAQRPGPLAEHLPGGAPSAGLRARDGGETAAAGIPAARCGPRAGLPG